MWPYHLHVWYQAKGHVIWKYIFNHLKSDEAFKPPPLSAGALLWKLEKGTSEKTQPYTSWVAGSAFRWDRWCLRCQAGGLCQVCSSENRTNMGFSFMYTLHSWVSLSKTCAAIWDGHGPWLGNCGIGTGAFLLELFFSPSTILNSSWIFYLLVTCWSSSAISERNFNIIPFTSKVC